MSPRVELVELDVETLRALGAGDADAPRRAAAEPGVTTVRATVGPGNTVSRDLVLAHGHARVGEQMDAEDGLGIVYERPVAPGAGEGATAG
jgi:hypothetical protein